MSVIDPVYSADNSFRSYHTNSDCPELSKIEISMLMRGTGDKELCSRCREINMITNPLMYANENQPAQKLTMRK